MKSVLLFLITLFYFSFLNAQSLQFSSGKFLDMLSAGTEQREEIEISMCEFSGPLQREKVNRAYQYLDRYISGELIKARLDLSMVLIKLYKLFEARNLDQMRRKANMIKTLTTEPSNFMSYNMMIEFFEAVHKCTKFGGCDQQTIINLFADDAYRLWIVTSPIIEQYRKTYNGEYALGLYCIASRYEDEICKI